MKTPTFETNEHVKHFGHLCEDQDPVLFVFPLEQFLLQDLQLAAIILIQNKPERKMPVETKLT